MKVNGFFFSMSYPWYELSYPWDDLTPKCTVAGGVEMGLDKDESYILIHFLSWTGKKVENWHKRGTRIPQAGWTIRIGYPLWILIFLTKFSKFLYLFPPKNSQDHLLSDKRILRIFYLKVYIYSGNINQTRIMLMEMLERIQSQRKLGQKKMKVKKRWTLKSLLKLISPR